MAPRATLSAMPPLSLDFARDRAGRLVGHARDHERRHAKRTSVLAAIEKKLR